MVIPLLEPLDIAGKTITADALLTQRKLATHLIERNAHDVFTAKDNQPTLREDIRLIFAGRGKPDFSEPLTLAHGRIEQRCIWTSTALNDYLVPEREIEFFDTSAIRAASSVAAFLVFAAHYGEWEPHK